METAAEIRKLVDWQLVEKPLFALQVTVSVKKPNKITVVIDGDSGVTIDDCANLSRSLNQAIDANGLLEDYTLEVTTPGVDQPLKLFRQYRKHVGRNVKIILKDKRILRGALKELRDDKLVIAEEIKNGRKNDPERIIEVPFDEIEKTFILISFK